LEVALGFKELLIILLSIDIFWVTIQNIIIWIVKKRRRDWSVNSTPWGWAILNLTRCILIFGYESCGWYIYSQGGLIFLLSINIAAFICDVILIDHYKTI
jgi:hypothetical protein